MNIALFGTSADPPTIGHQRILAWLARHYDQVVVWAADNPFKHHGASLDQRTDMLRLAAHSVQAELTSQLHSDRTPSSSHPHSHPAADCPAQTCRCNAIGVYPELSHPRSLITLQRAQQRWPQAQFTLVIGSDLVAQISHWYAIDQLLAQVNLLIVPRPGYALGEEALEWLRDRTHVTIAPIEGQPVSSSNYRQNPRPAQPDSIISPAVQAYIQQQQLYSSSFNRLAP